MNNNPRASQIIIIILAVSLIILYLVPIDLPNRVTTKGKLFSAKEWLLIKGTDGRLITSLFNHKKGINENFSVAQFERGDAIQFSIFDKIQSGSKIAQNDTIGVIYSNETEKQLADLRSALAVESSLLQVNLSKEKEAVVKSEQQRVEFAKKQFEEQEKLFRRQKALFEKNLISQEEYEVAQGAVELFRINVDIANEMLATVTTGAKEEQIDLIKSKIDGLKNQIDILERRFSDFVIQSPIDGIILRVFSGDTLMIISDTTEFIGTFPVNINELGTVKPGQTISIESPVMEEIATGEVVYIDPNIHSAGQNQYFILSAVFDNKEKNLLPGLIVEGSIDCDPLHPRDYINSFLTSLTK